MTDSPDRRTDESSKKRHAGRWLGATTLSIVVAGVTAFIISLASKAADRVGASKLPALSYYAAEVPAGCGPGIFVPEAAAQRLLRTPAPSEWNVVERQPGAVHFDRELVQVSIQGESARTVTLTGISVKVRRGVHPPGAIFQQPCGGPTVGRAIEVDLDTAR